VLLSTLLNYVFEIMTDNSQKAEANLFHLEEVLPGHGRKLAELCPREEVDRRT